MTKAIADVGKMMDYANDDRATTGWGDAVKKVCLGEAAMLILPDFTKGQFQVNDCGPGKAHDNIGYVPMQPDGKPTFVYVGITFNVTKGAPHHDMASAFVKIVGSKEGQEAFNPTKGSIPARIDVDRNKFDTISAQTATDFATTGENIVLGYAGLTAAAYQEAVNPALQAFVDPSKTEFKDA